MNMPTKSELPALAVREPVLHAIGENLLKAPTKLTSGWVDAAAKLLEQLLAERQTLYTGPDGAWPAPAKAPAEVMTRYCPDCGSVGPVPATCRDCCPDGMHARMIPAKLAEQCRATFLASIQRPALPLLSAAFRTTVTSGPAQRPVMVFAFESVTALNAADEEWRRAMAGVPA
jgi:hypothetical protein